jgi:hypothetical protein
MTEADQIKIIEAQVRLQTARDALQAAKALGSPTGWGDIDSALAAVERALEALAQAQRP